MAETAVKFLLGYVSQLYIHHASLISGAKYELRQLMNDLNLLQALLRDVATRPTEEEPMGDIKRGIKEAVYDLEDAIDTCLTFPATARTKSFSFSRHLRGKNDLGREVRTLWESKVKPQIEKLREHVSTLPLPSPLPSLSDAPTTSVEDPRNIVEKDRAILMREDNVVGLKNEEEIIINCLMEQSDELDVISIVGRRGLGKTTLAWKIYQNERIGCKFPTRIWVHVSQNFNEREAFLHILERFTSHVSKLSDEELLETVRACLEKEKFLLVLDDVCSLHHWEVMRSALPDCNGTSKVMITSSDDEVGANLNVPRDPHKLRLLTKEESWELLQLEVFGRLSDCPPQLEEIGEDIAGKCNGLPLQIVAVGGILVDLSTKSRHLDAIKDGWKAVCENVNLFLNDNGAISEAVKLTYRGLCDELKECFLYMGVFPEGYEISASMLTRLWIAEGFIQHEWKSLEEAAAQNLGHLINRNLVMVDKINSIGEVKTCRLPDMICGFCINEARKQNLFEEIRVPVVPELHRIRRLCVYGHSDVETLLSQLRQTPRLRSFLCFRTMPSGQDPSKISTILDKVDLLKVFESKSFHFNRVPRGITKLFHLRYITLSLEDLNVLPEGLSVLWNLQTLIIETRARCITVKANIWKLIQLRHLQINAAIVLSSKGGGEGGENLQTLSSLSPKSCTEVQERAQNLKKLGIRGKLDTLSRQDKFLKGFTRLEKLKLVNDSFPEIATSKNRLQWLAHSDSFPGHLKWLTLSNTFLEWKHMSTLGKINTLEVLKLKDNAFTGIYWNTEEDCFRSLVFLLIANTDLVIWEASDGALPSLRRLVLKNCRNLSEFPVALKCLEKLEIEHVNESAVTLATKIAEEKTKSSHSS